MPHHDAIIVGAGLAGMSCARRLLGDGIVPTIFEASDGVGGRVRTDDIDGFRCDRGFQIMLTKYPEAQLVLDYKRLDLRAFDPGAVVATDGEFFELTNPTAGLAKTLATATAPVGSVFDKARLAKLAVDVVRADAPDLLRGPDTTTQAWLRGAGFSTDFVHQFFRPFLAGIQLDPDLEVSSRFASVVLRTLLLGEAAVPATGMGAISAELHRQLPSSMVKLGRTVTEVTGGERPSVVVDGKTHTADAVIVATEGPAASRLLGLPDPGSAPVAAVWFGADDAPSDHRTVILDADRTGPAANVTVMSNVAPGYAPEGKHTIVAAVPGPVALEPTLLDDTRRQLERMFGRQVKRWTHLKTDVIRHGHPDQRPPFRPKQRVALGERLFVCGDHRDTASIQGALHSGRRCAVAVVEDLRSSL